MPAIFLYASTSSCKVTMDLQNCKKERCKNSFSFRKSGNHEKIAALATYSPQYRSDCSRVSVFVGNGRSLYRCDVTCMFFVSGYAFPNVPLAPFFSSRSEKAGFTNRSIKISMHKVLSKHPKTRGWSVKSLGFTGLDV